MKQVLLKYQHPAKVRFAHPWIFRSQIDQVDDTLQDGDLVEVFSAKKKPMGIGYFNSQSEITIRLLTGQKEPIDQAFFEKRIKAAWEFRQQHIHQTNAYRVIFSEADFLPGLIVDNYNGTFVIQLLTLGMDQLRPLIIKALQKICSPQAIYFRNDVAIRKQEGLPLEKGFLENHEGPTQIEIEENSTRYLVDIEKGHKTGFYLDQRANRQIFSTLVQGKKILDCFSSSGSFSLIATQQTEREVIGLENSEELIQTAEKNAQLNQLEKFCTFKKANVFDELKKYDQKKEKFDVVILDPPSFTRGKKQIQSAYAGYKEINLRAMKILNPGGLLVTASCSYHMTPELFNQLLLDAAKDAKVTLRLLHPGQQALDHPIQLHIPETQYLKCSFLEIHRV